LGREGLRSVCKELVNSRFRLILSDDLIDPRV